MIPLAESTEADLSNATASRPVTASFGRVFTDHMLIANYERSTGWQEARVQPYGPLQLDPATMALHYGQNVFEGIKAYRGDDGVVRLFRPQKYIERFSKSAERLCIPPIDEALALEWLLDFVRLAQAWVPSEPGSALYLRPFIFAADPYVGVRPSETYVFCLIASPVGAYYGDESLKILAEERHVRAVDGGVGAAKTGANYAASLLAAEEAHAAGYNQVLWLDGHEHRYLEEVGTMNIMLRIGDEVVTPPLGGSILDGVTRDTALTLLRDWGVKVNERRIAIDEVIEAARNGSLREMWGTGTAAGIAPIGVLGHQGRDYLINEGLPGEVSERLKRSIADMHYSRVADPHGWAVVV